MPTFLYDVAANEAAKPFERLPSSNFGGHRRGFISSFELADTANGDIAPFIALPVDATLPSCILGFDDLGSAGTVDIGFYRKQEDGTFVEVDKDALHDNLDVTSAVAMTEYRYSVKGIDTAGKKIWELAGLSARPAYGELWLAITTDTGTTQIGTVAYNVTIQQ